MRRLILSASRARGSETIFSTSMPHLTDLQKSASLSHGSFVSLCPPQASWSIPGSWTSMRSGASLKTGPIIRR